MKEYIDIVNEKDEVIGVVTRTEMHKNALLHRVSRIIIKNDKNEFLVQKRSQSKDIFPEYWDIGVAESVKSGSNYDSTAVIGLWEELGIKLQIEEINRVFNFIHKSENDNEICTVYEIVYNGDLKKQDEEIDEIKFLKMEMVKELISSSPFHPVGSIAMDKYLNISKLNNEKYQNESTSSAAQSEEESE
ncbi:MAG TPA: NUDIX domain-containing protein [Candidatus Nanoarchaeia archaeon]|nr:NUDIX domain-containing protein [Candidatus Nanoarchaeia archaeon]